MRLSSVAHLLCTIPAWQLLCVLRVALLWCFSLFRRIWREDFGNLQQAEFLNLSQGSRKILQNFWTNISEASGIVSEHLTVLPTAPQNKEFAMLDLTSCCWCPKPACGNLWKGKDKTSGLFTAGMALAVNVCVFVPQKRTIWRPCPLLVRVLWHQKCWSEVLLNLAAFLVAQNILQEFL